MATLEGFKTHAVLDGDYSDDELTLYLNGAMGYLQGAEVEAPGDTEIARMPGKAALYDLAAYKIATYYLDKRNVDQTASADVFGVQGIIHQLAGVFTGE